jgi:CcmD family protein
MDPILAEIYKTVLGAAPYVLAAYALLWVGLMGYIAMAMRRVSALERQLDVLTESLERRQGAKSA